MSSSSGSRLAGAGRAFGAFLAVLPVAITVRDNLVDYCFARGISMQPTINPYPDEETLRKYYFARYWQDVVLVDKLSIRAGVYQRGSVVLCQSVEDPRRFLIKRLVAVEGDWVESRQGDYVHLGKGQCWLEGDNADHSIDSNEFGPVPLGLIHGRIRYVCWPPWRASKLPDGDRPEQAQRVRSRPYQVAARAKQLIKNNPDPSKIDADTSGADGANDSNGIMKNKSHRDSSDGDDRQDDSLGEPQVTFDMTKEAKEIEEFLARVEEIKDEFGLNDVHGPQQEPGTGHAENKYDDDSVDDEK